jgi:hypothetical protein
MSTLVFQELFDSPGQVDINAERAGLTRKWVCTSSPPDLNEQDIIYAFAAPDGSNGSITPVAPYTYAGLNRASTKCDSKGGGVWFCTAEYGTQPTIAAVNNINTFTQYGGLGTPRGPEFNGDTTGRTVHITQALSTVWKISGSSTTNDVVGSGSASINSSGQILLSPAPSPPLSAGALIVLGPAQGFNPGVYTVSSGTNPYTVSPGNPGTPGADGGSFIAYSPTVGSSGGSAPDYEGAIGVSLDGVAGCDIIVPQFEFTVSGTIAPFDMQQLVLWYYLTGTTNQAPFWNFAIGEVLYQGATCQTTDGIQFRIAHKFVAQPTRYNVQISSTIYLPEVGGWSYISVAYQNQVSNNSPIQRPSAAYVYQVYPEGDFSQLGLGGS